jgi:hypothetical protein
MKVLDEYLQKMEVPETLQIFDETKMQKTFAEYVKENNAEHRIDPDSKNIYKSEFFLAKHYDYIDYIKTLGRQK